MTTLTVSAQALFLPKVGDICTNHSTGRKSFVTRTIDLTINNEKHAITFTHIPLSKHKPIRYFQIKYYRFKYRRNK